MSFRRYRHTLLFFLIDYSRSNTVNLYTQNIYFSYHTIYLSMVFDTKMNIFEK